MKGKDSYCEECLLAEGCNVILKEGESCEDKAHRKCKECPYFAEGEKQKGGARLCKAVAGTIYADYLCCDSFDFK